MSFVRGDILFYWDAENKSIVPTTGGQPTFIRNGTAFVRLSEVITRSAGVDTPRFEPKGLLLEPSQDNQVGEPFVMDGTTPWTNSNMTPTARPSIYEGKDAFRCATNDTANDRGQRQILSGTLGTRIAFYVDVENSLDFPGPTLESPVGIVDIEGGQFVIRVQFLWANRVASLGFQSGGTNHVFGAIRLWENGPNGGPVYRIWGAATPNNPSNTPRLDVPITELNQIVASIFHHAAVFTSSEIFTSPVEGVRAAEQLEWNRTFGPQAMVIYSRHLSGLAVEDGSLTTPRIWSIMESTSPYLTAYLDGGNVTAQYHNGTAVTTAAVTKAVIMESVVESVMTLMSDGSIDHAVRVDGGTVSSASGAAPSGGLVTTFNGTVITLNAEGDDSNKGSGTYQQLKFMNLNGSNFAVSRGETGGSRVTDSNEALLDEMSEFFLSTDATRISEKRAVDCIDNSTFDSNLNDWTLYVSFGTITWSSALGGHISFAQSGTQEFLTAEQKVDLVAGQVYVIKMVHVSGAAGDALGYVIVDSSAGAQDPETADQIWLKAGNVAGDNGLLNETVRAAFTVATSGAYFLKIIDNHSLSQTNGYDNVKLLVA